MVPRRVLLPVLALALAASAAACAGPCLLLPGGTLEGPVVEEPESWAFTDEVGTVQLETRPADPYSVNIWVVALGPHLYVHAGASRSTWVEHLEADPRARIRVEGALYELRAERVATQEEFDRFADAYERKYDRRPRNEDVREAYLFRLAAR